MQCYNKVHFLREGNNKYNTVACPPGYVPNPCYPGNNPANAPPAYGAPPRPTNTYFREPPPAAPAQANGGAPIASIGAAQWSTAGWLRTAGLNVDCRSTYALESSQGQLRLYVTAQPGANVNLDQYVNRNVMLYGPMWYRGDIKSNYMTVSQVQLLKSDSNFGCYFLTAER